MRFYRVNITREGGNSAGFSWHTSHAAALAAARADFAQEPAEYDGVFDPPARIEVVTVTPTKAGILAALALYASHPDNG